MPDPISVAKIEPFVRTFAEVGVLIVIKVTLVLGLTALLLRIQRRASSTSRSAIASLALFSGIHGPKSST